MARVIESAFVHPGVAPREFDRDSVALPVCVLGFDSLN
jgi:hypothetical protein